MWFYNNIVTIQKIEGNFLNLIEDICKTPTANILLHYERLKEFLLRSEQTSLLLPLLSNFVLEVLSREFRQEKEIKRYLDFKERSKTILIWRLHDLVLGSKFSKSSGYKSNIKESIVVVYNSNGQSINEIKQFKSQ